MSEFEEYLKDMPKKMQEVLERQKNFKPFCFQCKRETKQVTLFSQGEVITDPKEIISYDKEGNRKQSGWIIEGHIWKITQCQGCEKINLNVFSRTDPTQDDLLIHHFPTKDFRPFPMWATHLNKIYVELICEIYLSLNTGNVRLPLMGARTLLDMFIVDKIGDVGTFKQKIERFFEEKYISKSNKELLEIALEYGHATSHRAYTPSKDEINGVLDIVENILKTEALIDKTKELKKSIPKRK